MLCLTPNAVITPRQRGFISADQDGILSPVTWESRQIHFCYKKGAAFCPLALLWAFGICSEEENNSSSELQHKEEIHGIILSVCLQTHMLYWPGCNLYNFFLYFLDLFTNGFCDSWEMRSLKVHKNQSVCFLPVKEQLSFYPFLSTSLTSDALFRLLKLFY